MMDAGEPIRRYEGCTMNKSLLAAATALLLVASTGSAMAKSHGHDRHDRDCDGITDRYDHHDKRNVHDRDCDGIANRFDHRDGRNHHARRSFAGPRYVAPRDYRYVRYSDGMRLPAGYWGSAYYVDYGPYGLAPPPSGYRWNRVGNDVYLVSVRDGLIAEAIYSLFH
jgi:Ni/Co efflux regulator RcnB